MNYGNNDGKKFMIQYLMLLIRIKDLPEDEQEKEIEAFTNAWLTRPRDTYSYFNSGYSKTYKTIW